MEAELKFDYSVNGYGSGDLTKMIDEVSDGDVTKLVAEYEEKYSITSSLRKGGDRHTSLRDAAKIEAGLRAFLQAVWSKPKLTMAEGHAIMNLCMAATYDPDPRAPNGFRLPFNLETGELLR